MYVLMNRTDILYNAMVDINTGIVLRLDSTVTAVESPRRTFSPYKGAHAVMF